MRIELCRGGGSYGPHIRRPVRKTETARERKTLTALWRKKGEHSTWREKEYHKQMNGKLGHNDTILKAVSVPSSRD